MWALILYCKYIYIYIRMNYWILCTASKRMSTLIVKHQIVHWRYRVHLIFNECGLNYAMSQLQLAAHQCLWQQIISHLRLEMEFILFIHINGNSQRNNTANKPKLIMEINHNSSTVKSVHKVKIKKLNKKKWKKKHWIKITNSLIIRH